MLSEYARSIRSARYTSHTPDFRGAYATVTLRFGTTGPSRTFYYSPENFYVLGVDIQGTAYFTSDATPWGPSFGTRLPFDSRHATLGTYGLTVGRDWVGQTFRTTLSGLGNNLKSLFSLGAVFFAEALRSEPVLEACAKMLGTTRETLDLGTLELYCSNWNRASVHKNAGIDQRTDGFEHRWLGLDKAHYPAQ